MSFCTFFGHSKIHCENLSDILSTAITNLITNEGVTDFYIGNQGDFDRITLKTLRELQSQYPFIRYSVILAYHPTVSKYSDNIKSNETLFPEELEKTHPKFAIAKRNEWMIAKSDYAITYVNSEIGGAAKYKTLAEKNNLITINLYDIIR